MNPVWHFVNGVPALPRLVVTQTLAVGQTISVGSGTTITSGTLNPGSTGSISFGPGTLITGIADGTIKIQNNGGTAGIGFDVNTDGLIKIRNRAQNADAALSVGGGSLSQAPLIIGSGTNLTTALANAIENDGAAFYHTMDTTNGRRYWDGWNYFNLTGSGTGITTIADFFGATGSGIPLVANGFYEIEWFCYFSQATAGIATWTIVTATTALATLTGEYVGSPIAGIGAVGTPQTAGINVATSSSQAFPVTGTEADAATHRFAIRVKVKAGNGASNTRLRLAMSAGTATPLVNSYFRVRRLSGANVGTFAT